MPMTAKAAIPPDTPEPARAPQEVRTALRDDLREAYGLARSLTDGDFDAAAVTAEAARHAITGNAEVPMRLRLLRGVLVAIRRRGDLAPPMAALAALPPAQREVVAMLAACRLTPVEMAVVLACPVPQVAALRAAARQSLARHVPLPHACGKMLRD